MNTDSNNRCCLEDAVTKIQRYAVLRLARSNSLYSFGNVYSLLLKCYIFCLVGFVSQMGQKISKSLLIY